MKKIDSLITIEDLSTTRVTNSHSSVNENSNFAQFISNQDELGSTISSYPAESDNTFS